MRLFQMRVICLTTSLFSLMIMHQAILLRLLLLFLILFLRTLTILLLSLPWLLVLPYLIPIWRSMLGLMFLLVLEGRYILLTGLTYKVFRGRSVIYCIYVPIIFVHLNSNTVYLYTMFYYSHTCCQFSITDNCWHPTPVDSRS